MSFSIYKGYNPKNSNLKYASAMSKIRLCLCIRNV